LITHHFKLADIVDAYDAFANAATTGALKVIIEADLKTPPVAP
jgi:alcohol dehydrogenase